MQLLLVQQGMAGADTLATTWIRYWVQPHPSGSACWDVMAELRHPSSNTSGLYALDFNSYTRAMGGSGCPSPYVRPASYLKANATLYKRSSPADIACATTGWYYNTSSSSSFAIGAPAYNGLCGTPGVYYVGAQAQGLYNGVWSPVGQTFTSDHGF